MECRRTNMIREGRLNNPNALQTRMRYIFMHTLYILWQYTEANEEVTSNEMLLYVSVGCLYLSAKFNESCEMPFMEFQYWTRSCKSFGWLL